MKHRLISALLYLGMGFAAQALAQPTFNAIDISGPVNVEITEQPSQASGVQWVGGSADQTRGYAVIKNKVLYVQLKPATTWQKVNKSSDILVVKITMPQLQQLRYSGSGNVIGRNLSGVLNVQDTGSGVVDLRGNIVLHNLVYKSNAPLSIEWVNSTEVNVTGSGHGKIFLAGIAGQLNATLSDQVLMDAQYLHANKGFINTRGKARADVWTKYNLSALATRGSNIYYYHDSQMVAGYMVAPGAVIRMTGIDAINR